MAKEDFCFTYYDGDAARDMQHMDRLTRGAYNDLVIMQRKVGKLEMKHIKMVLGSDFDKCWDGLEFILKVEDEKYFIEWVEISVKKSKQNSEKNAKKIKDYWDSDKGKERKNILTSFQNDTTVSKKDTNVIPLEDGYGDGDVYETIIINKNGFFINEIPKNIFLEKNEIDNTKIFIEVHTKVNLSDEDVGKYFEAFKIDNLDKKEWKNSRSELISHFRNSLKLNLKNGNNKPGIRKNRNEQLDDEIGAVNNKIEAYFGHNVPNT